MSDKRHLQVGATMRVLDELIDRHAEAYSEAYPEVTEFSNFERSGAGKYYIGMVWTRDNERPNTQQLKLRGSSSLTNNKMVELDLSAIDSQQSFFPGQVLAFLADPFIKRQLTVRRILDSVRIAPRLKSLFTHEQINLMVAVGPFMKLNQEDWTLIDKIIEAVQHHKVTHLVLAGPHVDEENEAVKGKYDVVWRTYFDKLVDGLVDHQCNVYLVPSGRDLLPNYLVPTRFYPSPPINFDVRVRDNVKPKCNIKSVSDPAQIDLGGVYVDVTSADVLFHLNRCSSFVNKGGSTFASMYRHLLSHGLYPIYPPPADIAVDYPKLEKHIRLDRLGPHILVIPTRFNTAVSNVEDRLIVAVQKCSTRKEVVLVKIPKIEGSSSDHLKSVVLAGYETETINLCETSH